MKPSDTLIANFERDSVTIKTLFQRAEATGYLLLPNNLTPGVRTYAANRYSDWCRENNAWCLTVAVAIDNKKGGTLRDRVETCSFATPAIRKWNVINSALSLLAGDGAKLSKNQWSTHGKHMRMIEYSDRFDISVFRPELVRACLDIFDMPEARAFLTTFETRGRRSK